MKTPQPRKPRFLIPKPPKPHPAVLPEVPEQLYGAPAPKAKYGDAGRGS